MRKSQQGFLMVELTLATAFMAVLCLSVIGLFYSSVTLNSRHAEMTRAQNAARQVVEQIRAEPADRAFALYNEDPSDNPLATWSSSQIQVTQGTFQVQGLKGGSGKVVFPVQNGAISERLATQMMGTTMDLDSDGNAQEVSIEPGSWRVLPVEVVIQWTLPSGQTRQYRLSSILRRE